ncbi:hypothetical protein EW146_g4780 [Bondarzewia mesenterica]|uniref:Uncharacterized protein n=1 Tax=Bondarzewia mesenterica TaxID=1095465 RepID=A0A4S4LVC2_9AGAM|nr:hypothetical protein EW146_g4780 [Bondarzewia mesenterica]
MVYASNVRETIAPALCIIGLYLYSLVCLMLAYVLGGAVSGHTLRVGRIKPLELTVWNVNLRLPPPSKLSASPSTFASFTSLCIIPRLPTLTSPTFLTLTLTRPHFTTPLCTVTVDSLTVRLNLFPTLARVSAGPWADVTLEMLRLRVYTSGRTPNDVKRLREALVGTLLFGEILRVDEFKTSIFFGPDFAGRGRELKNPHEMGADVGSRKEETRQDSGSEEEKDMPESEGEGEKGESAPIQAPVSVFASSQPDDLLVQAHTRRLHVHDRKGRIYTFGYASACLRRTWGAADLEGQRGSYHMEAVDSQWRKLPPFVLGEKIKNMNAFRYFLTLPFSIPHHLYTLVHDPLRYIDLSVPHAFIQFDDFRIRDAELVNQGFEMLSRMLLGREFGMSGMAARG